MRPRRASRGRREMPALAAVQAWMREAVRAPEGAVLDRSPLRAVLAGGGAAAIDAARARYRAGSAAALAAAYPGLRAALGAGPFHRLAAAFLDRHPPAGPCLLDHGAALPPFLAGYPPARTQCHLPELARLDWVIHRVRHAADAPRLDPAGLAAIPRQRLGRAVLGLAPDLACLKSTWPVDRLRAQVLAGSAGSVGEEEGGVRLIVQRRAEAIAIRRVGPAEYAFVAALAVGRQVFAARDAAFGRDACFADEAVLTALVASGAVASVRFPDPLPGAAR